MRSGIILLLIALMLPELVIAQPSIMFTQEGATDGEPFIISGSGFGNVAPEVHHGVGVNGWVEQNSVNTPVTALVGAPGWGEVIHPNNPDAIISTADAYSGTKSILGNAISPSNGEYSRSWGYHKPEGFKKAYFEVYVKFDVNSYTDQGTNINLKPLYVTGGSSNEHSSCSTAEMFFGHIDQTSGGSFGWTGGDTVIKSGCTNGGTSCVMPPQCSYETVFCYCDATDNWGNTGVFAADVDELPGGAALNAFDINGNWTKLMVYIEGGDMDQANGMIEVYNIQEGRTMKHVTTTEGIRYHQSCCGTIDSSGDFTDIIFYGMSFLQDATKGSLNADWYWDDPYVQFGTQARVVMCDSANYYSSTKCEIQPSASWSDNSITVEMNYGTFNEGDITYLFVIDDAGVVSDARQISLISMPVGSGITLSGVTGDSSEGGTLTITGSNFGTHSSLNSITWWGGSDPSGTRYTIENQPTGFFKGTSAQPPNTDYIYSGGLKDQITTTDSWSGTKAINLQAIRQVGSPDDLYDNAVSTLSVIYPEFDRVFVSYWAKISVDQWPGSLRLGNKMNRLTKYPLYDGCTGGYDNLRSNREVWAIDWSITPDNSLASAPMTTTYAGWNCFVTETESYTQAAGNGYDVESQVYNRNRPFRGYNADNVPQDIREKYWFNLDEWVRVDLTWDYGSLGNYDGSQKFTLIRPAGNYPGMWTGSDLSNIIMQIDSPSIANGGCNRCDPGKPNVFSFYNFWQADGYSFNVNYYVDDFYMQVGTQARVELCNNQVYTQSSKCEIQKPSSWTSSQIQFETNFGGSFNAGDRVYLFVIDDNGNTSTGYPITLGSSQTTEIFNHPGAHVNEYELTWTKARVDNNEQPWAGALTNLQSQSFSQLNYISYPRAIVYQGPYATPDVGGWAIMLDGRAAYAHALLWVYTGDVRHADKAAEILNGWATTLTQIGTRTNCPTGNPTDCDNAELVIAGASSSMANAAEILKHWPGYNWDAQQIADVEDMFYLFYDVNKNFRPGYNGNWDTLITNGMMSMGVFLDNQTMYDRAVEYFKTGIVSEGLIGNGVVTRYIPDETGFTQETTRDSEHEGMGIAGLVGSAQTAMHQGEDLYGYMNHRLFYGVDGSQLRGTGSNDYTWGVAARLLNDGFNPEGGWEMAYAHYNGRLGMPMPNTNELITQRARPERYGTFASVGFGTLTSYGVPADPNQESCYDGMQNQGETGIDCGGPCAACTVQETCTDGILNQDEVHTDCGGSTCAACECYEPSSTSCTTTAGCAGEQVCVDGTYDSCVDSDPNDGCPAVGDYLVLQNGLDITGYGTYNGQIGARIESGWNCDLCDQTFDAYNSVRTPTGNYARKRLMEFDTSMISTDKTVLSATLELYEDNGNSGASNVRLSRILKNWNSTSVTYRCTSDTGQDGCVSPEIPWQTLGVEGTTDVDQNTRVTTLVNDGWNTWDITPFVQEWINNPTQNYGLLIEEMDSAAYQNFRDYDYPTPNQQYRPKLTITLAANNCNYAGYDITGECGVVGFDDFLIVVENFRTTNLRYDFNNDNVVNILDLVLHLLNWNSAAPVCNYNSVQDNGETGVDCGGGGCPVCAPSAVCNNNVLESGEQCDTSQLNGASCISLGYDGGTLSCSSSCTFDTSSCTNTPPTNGIQGIASVTKVEQLTGEAATVSTVPVNIYGTDLGSMFTHDNGRIYFLFGDTFGPPGHPEQSSSDWRSNTMSYTTDFVASDGITFDGWITDSFGEAKSLVPRGSGEVTKIPTAGWSINGRQYMWFMSVSQWISGGVWTTNFAELAYSDDNGQNWVRSGTQWPGDSNFVQVTFAEHDGYLYVWGIPAGRFGGVKLARVLPQNILDKNSYEYYTGSGWSSNEADGQIIVNAPVGEHSVIWNPYLQRWIMTYLNENARAIEIRESVNPEGPWSAPLVVARSSTYPALYGAYMHPQFIENNGKTVYFLMSQWAPYNVFLMKMTFD